MAKKDIILEILKESKVAEATTKFLHTIFDQIKVGEEDDKELVAKVEALKANIAEELPKFIEETYVPEYDKLFTEEELQKILDDSRSEFGQKLKKFQEDLVLNTQGKSEEWMKGVVGKIFTELFAQ